MRAAAAAPGRSARLALGRARAGETRRSGRRAAAVRPPARCRDRAGQRATRWPWIIEPLTSPDGPRRRPRHRGGVVHQSVDARDVSRRAREPGRVVLSTSRATRPPRSSASARSGGCSTSCTSTTWRCCRTTGARASAPALLDARAGRGRPVWAPPGDARSARVERRGPAPVRALRLLGRRRPPRLLHATRSRTPSCSGAKISPRLRP